MLPFFSLLLLVLVPLGVLAVDGSRLMAAQSALQNAADSLAVAAAYELDRQPATSSSANDDAISRARSILTLDKAKMAFGGETGLKSFTIQARFFSQIPPSDSTVDANGAVPSSYETADPTLARFVEVALTSNTYPTLLPTGFYLAAAKASAPVSASITLKTRAVAGNDPISCGIQPMMICNPFERAGDSWAQATDRLRTASASMAQQSRLFALSAGSSNRPYTQGVFGYIQPSVGAYPSSSCFQGAAGDIGQAVAMSFTPTCYRHVVNIRPGDPQEGKDGLNTRFGLYSSSFKASCQTQYPPDTNVRKGYRPQSGNNWATARPDDGGGGTYPWAGTLNNIGFPVDQDQLTGAGPQVGNGSWDCLNSYWRKVYGPSVTPPPGCGVAGANTISRYGVYLYEIARPALLATTSYSASSLAANQRETGTQQVGVTGVANRRYIQVGIANCLASNVTSNSANIQLAGIGKFFIANPTPSPTQDARLEFMGLIKDGDADSDRVIYDQVQLYR